MIRILLLFLILSLIRMFASHCDLPFDLHFLILTLFSLVLIRLLIPHFDPHFARLRLTGQESFLLLLLPLGLLLAAQVGTDCFDL